MVATGDGKFQVTEERAAVVREMFQLRADGMGVRAITRELNRRKIPPFSKKPWGCSTVWKPSLRRSHFPLPSVASLTRYSAL